MTEPDVVTASEAARLLGVKWVTVRRWAIAGRLTPIRDTPPWLFNRADVKALARTIADELGDDVREAAQTA